MTPSGNRAARSDSGAPARLRLPAWSVFFALVSFRLLNALLLRTFFQPDEFFQSLEPAWQMAFGEDQGAWITWVSQSETDLMAVASHELLMI